MRPQSLTPLFAQTTSLPGIGPRLGKLVEKLAGPLVVDLLWHLPFAVVDRRNAPEVLHAKAGEIATMTVTVDEHLVPRNPRQPYRVWCSDETGRLCLTYFNGREDYLKKLLPPGEVRVVSGKAVTVCEFTVVPTAEVAVWIVSTFASTVTCSDCWPTSSARSSVAISVTTTSTLASSAVLNPGAENFMR